MEPPGCDARSEAAIAAGDRRRALRETCLLALAATLIAAVGVLGLWIAATRMIRDNYGNYLASIARTAAQRVDADLHRQLRDPVAQEGQVYAAAVAPLREMLKTLPDVNSIYTMVREDGVTRFVLDAAEPGDHNGDGLDDQAHLWEVYTSTEPAMEVALGGKRAPGRSAVTTRPYPDKWGSFMTGWSPLVDRAGRQYGALGVDVDAHVYFGMLHDARRWALLGLGPATLLIVLLTFGFHRLRTRQLAAARDAARSAHALASERQRLGDIVEQLDIGTWETIMGPDGGPETWVDSRWAAMMGRRPEELNPLRPDAFIPAYVHPDDAHLAANALQRTFSGANTVFTFDVRLRHARGHWVWTHVLGKVTGFDEQGRPRRVVGTQTDVSARKAIESALSESESNLRSLFEHSPIGITLCELPSGRFLKVNDALVAFSGFSRAELLQRTFWDLTPPRHHDFERELHAGLGAGSSFGPYEKEYLRPDGSSYPVLVSGMRVRDAKGRELGWGIVQDISKRKAMEAELAAAANCDRLTGLANRALFLQWVRTAIARVRDGRQRSFAALFLDFDRFKLVNDALGHEAGDGLLREIAARLREAVGTGPDPLDGSGRNLVARFGGDEFLVLLNDADGAAAQQIADAILASLARPFLLRDREVFSTASIGIVTSDRCLESAEAVVRNADVAMYEAKRLGRACAVLFDDAMGARLTRYVTIESQLRAALDSDQFSVVYQPIVDLATGHVTSVEALARWDHPTLGAVSPAEFIAVAEESGLIVRLGERVLDEACAALATWRAMEGEHSPRTVCVNISRLELALGKRLLQRVSDTLFRFGLPPQCLRLEVTERDTMRDPVATLQLMRELRDMGVRLAMDDFGTGTSSLGCLRDFPFDVIKIDRSFVSDVTTSPEVLALIHAAVTLTQNLGKTSVAEGVETAEQRAILQSLGCQYGQGYYFSRPLSRDEISGFMAQPVAARA